MTIEKNIVLVDDHTLFRDGLKKLLDGRRGCRVVGEFSDGSEFVAALPSLANVDIVFMDIAMPTMGGEQAARLALQQRPDLNIVSLSMFGEEQYYLRMVEAGTKGFLLKDSDMEEVFAAIESVVSGETYFSKALLDSLPQRLRKSEPSDGESLSERESDILLGICQGLSNQEIADSLFISKRTVDAHRANILEKTGCKNTASLVVYAMKNHLVEI